MFSLRSLSAGPSRINCRQIRAFSPFSGLSAVRAFSSKVGFRVPDALANIGSNVFEPKKRLKGAALKAYNDAVNNGTALDSKARDEIALALQKWAMDKGAVNFSHWFSALRGTNAEKHDSMIDLNYATGDIKVEFNSGRLFQGETDGSSFPNGGLRSTHRAAAYMGWDLTSPPFIRGDTLFVPSAFITYNGDPLDDKTPLLRSQEAINDQGLRLLRALGDKESKGVVSNVGWEQEFFVIDREMYQRRPDLVSCGRTLIGAIPHRGQQTEAHYFARPPLRIRAFLREVQATLWALGLSLNTYHNEVAPSQHELSPIFSVCSRAADLNTLSIEVMHEVAARHGLTVLTHEKPFAKINGSGKHNNWGLNTDTGANLFVPGKNVEEQRRFVAFVAALARTINVHGDVLRVGVATAGNDHRLGAQEAPPAIISLYTGEFMEKHLRSVVNGGPLEGYTKDSHPLPFGTRAVQNVQAAKEDRNRTAPFPFCGNRFEFRAVGANQNVAFPLALLNAAMAESMGDVAGRIEKGANVRDAIALTLKENFRCIFNGNGYAPEWQEEAKKRGLWNLKTTPEAIEQLVTPKNIALFESQKVFNKGTLEARVEVMYHEYIETILIEVNTLLEMMYTGVIPACLADNTQLQAVPKPSQAVNGYVAEKVQLTDALIAATNALREANDKYPSDGDNATQAKYCRDVLKTHMANVRKVSDQAERVVTHSMWPFPKYDEILYTHHPESEYDSAQGL